MIVFFVYYDHNINIKHNKFKCLSVEDYFLREDVSDEFKLYYVNNIDEFYKGDRNLMYRIKKYQEEYKELLKQYNEQKGENI